MNALPAHGRVREPLARFLLSQDFVQLADKARTIRGVHGKSLQGSFEFAAVARQLKRGQTRQGMFRRRDIRSVGRHRVAVPLRYLVSWTGPLTPRV
jgi:hypothetical protein